MCVVALSKHDLSIYCTFYFFFYLLVKLFTLPELIALVNKDLQKIVAAHTVVERLNELLFLESVSVSGLENLGFKKIKF